MNRVPSLLLLAIAGVGGCSVPHRMPDAGDIPLVHKIEIQQGNVVTQEMLSQLQLGMEKNKVLFVMGTPVIKDTFHANRWDYLYMLKKGRHEAERRHVVLYFEDDKLARIDGDVRPAPGPMEPIPRENRQVVVPDQYQPGFITRMINHLPFVKTDDMPDIPKKGAEKAVASGDAAKAAAAKGTVGGTAPVAMPAAAEGKRAAAADSTASAEPAKPGFLKRIFTKSKPEAPPPAPAPADERPAEPAPPTSAPPTSGKSEPPAAAAPDSESGGTKSEQAKGGEPEYGNIMNRGPVLDPGGGEDGEPDVGPLPAPAPY